MFCTHCGKETEDGNNFCASCGSPLTPKKPAPAKQRATDANAPVSITKPARQAPQSSPLPAPKVDEKLQKKLKNAGNSAHAIGWFSLVASIGLYFWTLSDPSIIELGFEADLTTTIPYIAVSAVFIILGNRIRKNLDTNTLKYIRTLGLLLILLIIINLIVNQRMGALAIILLIYLIGAELSLRKALKNGQAVLTQPTYKIKKKHWIILATITVVATFIGYLIDVAQYEDYVQEAGLEAVYTDDYGKEEIIVDAVSAIKDELPLPTQIDEVTTLNNVSAQPSAIRYHYSVVGADATAVGGSAHKSELVSNSCNNSDTRLLLDGGINLEYSYQLPTTTKLVTVSGTDCL